MNRKDELRQKLRENILCDEAEALQRLLAQAQLSTTERAAITDIAKALITTIRSDSQPQLTESFLAQYELSTDEGIALMCLAEALLRVPDTETVDALIHDKIVPADWGKHLGQSSSSLVNASTWALMLTGKVIDDGTSPGVVTSLRGAIKRLGEPVIRTAVNQAIRELGNQFVLGETIKKAIENAEKSPQYTYSYDMLGEAARTEADAKRYHLAYSRAISTMGDNCKFATVAENPGISIKLSALHPRYEYANREKVMIELVARTRSLAMLAQSANMGFNIDAEEADRLDLSMDVIETVLAEPSLKGWDGFGIVVQAYSKRAPYLLDCLYDMAQRLDRRIMVRLVKGAYWDYEIKQAQLHALEGFPVFTKKCNTDVSYIACAKQLFGMADRIYPQFATHNAHTVAAVLQLAGIEENTDKPVETFEFQRLHGMGDALHSQVMKQYNTRCRIYAPVGAHEDLLAYLVRRLLENGANSSFVNQIVDESISVDEVAADPFTQVETDKHPSHPAITFASELFAPQRKNSKGYWLSDPLQIESLNAERNNFKQHQWLAGDTGNPSREIKNPANRSDIIGHCHDATEQQVQEAVNTATNTYADWNKAGFINRGKLLQGCADQLETHSGELCAVLSREAGKTLPDCIAEIREAVDFLRYYAIHANELAEQHSIEGRGVFVCISPWNFPLAIFCGQIAAALACGNTVLAKPAEQTPLIAARTVQLFHQAGIPEPVLQLLPGDGGSIGNLLVSHPDIAGVCFTGSTATAQLIHKAIANHGNASAVFIAETGGLNAMIVDSTALPEQAVASVIESAFQSAGQRCSALRVLYVQEDIYDKFLNMLTGAMDLLACDDPWQLRTDLGPLIDAEAYESIAGYIETNKNKLLHQTHVIEDKNGNSADNYFVEPALIAIDGIANLDKEIFGPVLHLAKYKAGNFFNVIKDINNSGYGLTFGLHTRVDERVQDAVSAIDAGNVYINRNQIGAIVESQPFGGKKLSGTGPKAGGPHYLLRFLKEQEDSALENSNPVTAIAQSNNQTAGTPPDLQNAVTGEPLIPHISSLLKTLPAPLTFCTQTITHALRLAEAHFHPTIDLPGPTGESNRLSMEAAGTILCLHSGDDANWLAHTIQCIALGNAVIMAGPGATSYCTTLSDWLRDHNSGSLHPVDQQPDATVIDEIISSADIAAIAINASPQRLKSIRQNLAEREGPVVSLATTLFDLSPIIDEKSLCIDTTAAGGNASLLAAAS